MAVELHFDDLVAIVIASGLGDISDAEAWLTERGICGPAVSQYSRMVREVAVAGGDRGTELMQGIFSTGLTLGIAVAESRAEPRTAALREAVAYLTSESMHMDLCGCEKPGDEAKCMFGSWAATLR